MLVGATSCSDFLEEKNYSGQSAEKYFATAKGYETLIYGCYADLKNIHKYLKTNNQLKIYKVNSLHLTEVISKIKE